MKKPPFVSIPICTYNGAEFLKQQIESIYAQTYKNIEVIACDDASTDNTVKILEKYHLSHGLKYYVHKKNVGVNKNVSKALSLCSGDFIATSDQDDIWEKDKIQRLIHHIKESCLIYSLSTPIDENNNPLVNFSIRKKAYVNGNNNLAFLFTNCVSGHTLMFKREILPFLETIPQSIYPDWWIAFVASTYGKITFLDESLVYYRRHSSQLTNSQKHLKSNFFFKFTNKEKVKKQYILNLTQQLSDFSTLSILDNSTKTYIENLKTEFQNFSHLYYNKNLEHLLQEKEKEIFEIHSENISKYKKRFSRGLWYYRMRMYL